MSESQENHTRNEPINWVGKTLFFLSILGIITSIYLTYNHYSLISDPQTLSFCDLGSVFNCSKVNSSEYSEFLGTPVALLGIIFFSLVLYYSRKSYKSVHYYQHLIITLGFGFIFSLYLIYAEFVLKTICILCTLLHLIILSGLVFSIYALIKTKSWKQKFFGQYLKSASWAIIIVVLIISYTFFTAPTGPRVPNTFTQCLTEAGLVEYGSYTCSACLAQKKLLGPAFKYINYIECNPSGPNPDMVRCRKVPVEFTPTWTVEKNGTITNKKVGYLTLQQLSILSGCEVPKE
ncbi:vitamin K epoxide reductase family protein [Candidatus Woesearchaeota archaeon]|nr:vitamin K epoxide reductase family protein [Candidatus Woesearchaeota archaeon]